MILLLGVAGGINCSGCSKEPEPNPELKIPDVPPSSNGAKKMPAKK